VVRGPGPIKQVYRLLPVRIQLAEELEPPLGTGITVLSNAVGTSIARPHLARQGGQYPVDEGAASLRRVPLCHLHCLVYHHRGGCRLVQEFVKGETQDGTIHNSHTADRPASRDRLDPVVKIGKPCRNPFHVTSCPSPQACGRILDLSQFRLVQSFQDQVARLTTPHASKPVRIPRAYAREM